MPGPIRLEQLRVRLRRVRIDPTIEHYISGILNGLGKN